MTLGERVAAAFLVLVPVDVHVHFSAWMLPLTQDKLEAWVLSSLDLAGVERAVLLSDAYKYPPGKPARDPRFADARYEENERASSFVQRSPRLIGYCGGNLAWPDLKDVIGACLKLPGMRGVKLHTSWEGQSLVYDRYFSAFNEVLTSVEEVNGGVLLHAAFDRVDPIVEAERIRQAAMAHPGATVVIAHAAERSPEALAYLGRQLRDEPLRNVFAEISTVFGVSAMFKDNERRVMAAWREFGMDWMLFGSDAPFVRSPKLTREALVASPFEPDEIEGILFRNGKRFLDRIVR